MSSRPELDALRKDAAALAKMAEPLPYVPPPRYRCVLWLAASLVLGALASAALALGLAAGALDLEGIASCAAVLAGCLLLGIANAMVLLRYPHPPFRHAGLNRAFSVAGVDRAKEAAVYAAYGRKPPADSRRTKS